MLHPNRRTPFPFVLLSLSAALALLLGACAAPTPVTVVVTAPPVVETVTVRETVQVEVQTTVEVPVEITSTPAPARTLTVFGAYATPLEEPWDNVIHTALQAAQERGDIEYTWTDNIGYAGDMERVLREEATRNAPDIIFGDAFGNRDAVAKVAGEFPEIAFVFGSDQGPQNPNLSVFDNWIHEPAYLCGLIAGKMTQSNTIGVVAAMPIPEVNRIVNAFIQGAKEANPDAQVSVSFINSFFDPASAKEAALAQIDAGADIIYAEREGAIEAAAEHQLFAFGSLTDQSHEAPDYVLTSPLWFMGPTVDFIIGQVKAGTYTAQDLKDFSTMVHGGADLAPYHDTESKIPADVIDLVNQKREDIINGVFRVDINEAPPASAGN
jgi:basic membrane lipoprotein Med (substrate-binding protein (PBP1-ABC) superfamily)